MGLFILSAVSGTGKSTLARKLCEIGPRWQVSVSHTTRAPRGQERHGQHYHFCSKDEFERMVDAGAFVEWASYLDQFYGTSFETVRAAITQRLDLLFDIEINGARQVKTKFPESHSVFLLPPSFDVLRQRLFGRATDHVDKVYRRLRKGMEELKSATGFDYLVLNDNLDHAVRALELIRDDSGGDLPDERERLSRIMTDMSRFLEESDQLRSGT